ncbi:response regulator [Rheinheimera sp.]|uniref:response regulator n=1 Tax=Rheinheimera sp. TaxID=1869214 RepID=UPI0027BAB3C4|nr:response regulator [Rheinheimera sp.]
MHKLNLSGLQILVVDDQRPFQVMLKGILKSLGMVNIQFASSGEQALSRCGQTEFDLLFVDYNLGAGKNGRQLLEDLREKQLLKASAIFIIVTGENTVTMVMSAVETEPDDYLIKPFSQSLLKTRLLKLQHKKQHLAALYEALYLHQSAEVIVECEKEIAANGRYEQYCRRVLAETLLNQQNFSALESLLSDSMQQRRPTWALLLEAKFRLQQQDHQRCLALCDEIIELNRLCAQALDIKCNCQLAQGDTEGAMQSVTQAIYIAPFQLGRQYLLLKVAREAASPMDMVQASKQIYELTRRTAKQDVSHLLNYIRTMLDAIVSIDEPAKRNKLQQETLLLLHRSQKDELLLKDVDFERFEQLCMARLDAIEGRYHQAKKAADKICDSIKGTEPDVPDLVMLLIDIGEFEGADHFLAMLSDNNSQDPVLAQMLSQHQLHSEDKRQQLTALNKTGMDRYQEGKYQEAMQLFEQALQVAPGNTGAALNLIQAMLQVLESQQKQKSLALYQRCRQIFKTIEQELLMAHHQQRFAQLQQQYQGYRQELKQSS